MGSCNPSGSACISCRNLVFFDQKSTQTERHRTNFRKKNSLQVYHFDQVQTSTSPDCFNWKKFQDIPTKIPFLPFLSPWLRPLQRTRCCGLWKRHVGEVLHATFPPWNLKFCQVEPSEKSPGGRSYTRRGSIHFVTFSSPNVGGGHGETPEKRVTKFHHPKKVTLFESPGLLGLCTLPLVQKVFENADFSDLYKSFRKRSIGANKDLAIQREEAVLGQLVPVLHPHLGGFQLTS